MNQQLKRALAGGLLMLLGSSTPWAQEGEQPVPLPPPLGGQEDSAQADLQKELRELFVQVEQNLIKIDNQLADAGAGDVQLEDVEDAGLDDLLRSVQDKGNQTKSQIDRILEIARELDQSSGGSGSGSSKKPSSQPKPGQDSQGSQQEENTPEAKQPGQEGEGEKPEDQKPKPDPKGDPKDGGNSEERGGENFPSGDPQKGSQGRVQHNLEADKWGFLPERQQRTFRNQGRDNLPVQYRQWIDTYYRRLNKDTK